MTKMINVAVAGYAGRMGSAVVDAVTAAEDLTLFLKHSKKNHSMF